PLVHRPIEKPGCVEDLEAVHAPVEVAERHALRRKGVVRDLRTTGGGSAHERTLADVRIARDYNRRDRRVDLRDPTQTHASGNQGIEVRGDLLHHGRETAVRLPA